MEDLKMFDIMIDEDFYGQFQSRWKYLETIVAVDEEDAYAKHMKANKYRAYWHKAVAHDSTRETETEMTSYCIFQDFHCEGKELLKIFLDKTQQKNI